MKNEIIQCFVSIIIRKMRSSLYDVHSTSRRTIILLQVLLLGGIIWLMTIFIRGCHNDNNELMKSVSWRRHGAMSDPKLLQEDQDMTEYDPWVLFIDESSRSKYVNDMEVRLRVKRYGENGEEVILPDNLPAEIQKQVDEAKKLFGLNQYVSDLISVRRKLPDMRDERCKIPGRYLESLSRTSVIIIFHNEAYSVLLRTVHSVLDRSPEHLVEEIILVDDFSDLLCLKLQLEEYMERYPKVKILRTAKREGLIRARVIGAKKAIGPVLTFLDSHCECTIGWLEPLLDRVTRNRNTVAAPMIDGIGIDTFAYNKWNNYYIGFTWSLELLWHFEGEGIVPNSTEPVRSPALVGGEFSIDKEFFESIGTYDTKFDTWGSENFELSFKAWTCGGVVENLPCSRVAHNYRWKPYKFDDRLLLRNNARLAKVWMDDYAQFYFEWRAPDMIDYYLGDPNSTLSGDISSRIELRKRLNCKPFKWYLKNVIPGLQVPSEALSHGEVRNLAYDAYYCLDRYDGAPIIYSCHDNGNYRQFWVLSETNEIRAKGECIENNNGKLSLKKCHNTKGNQQWIYNPQDKLIRHGDIGECMAMSENKKDVIMEICNGQIQRQQWAIETYNASRMAKEKMH